MRACYFANQIQMCLLFLQLCGASNHFVDLVWINSLNKRVWHKFFYIVLMHKLFS